MNNFIDNLPPIRNYQAETEGLTSNTELPPENEDVADNNDSSQDEEDLKN